MYWSGTEPVALIHYWAIKPSESLECWKLVKRWQFFVGNFSIVGHIVGSVVGCHVVSPRMRSGCKYTKNNLKEQQKTDSLAWTTILFLGGHVHRERQVSRSSKTTWSKQEEFKPSPIRVHFVVVETLKILEFSHFDWLEVSIYAKPVLLFAWLLLLLLVLVLRRCSPRIKKRSTTKCPSLDQGMIPDKLQEDFTSYHLKYKL